eukprot:3324376-Rhodomonas_salina.1
MLRIGLLLKEASSPGSEEGAASMSGPSGIESLSPIMTCASGKTDDSDLLCVEIERTKATSSGAERRFICSNVPVSQQEINPPTMAVLSANTSDIWGFATLAVKVEFPWQGCGGYPAITTAFTIDCDVRERG